MRPGSAPKPQGRCPSTTLRELSVSFPLPTYRGSLVLAGSVFRRNILDAYTVRQGQNPDDD